MTGDGEMEWKGPSKVERTRKGSNSLGKKRCEQREKAQKSSGGKQSDPLKRSRVEPRGPDGNQKPKRQQRNRGSYIKKIVLLPEGDSKEQTPRCTRKEI